MKIYTDKREPLHEILRSASSHQGATLLIPDLQRPYVWTPNQITLLVDSLLRGWPFGTLLLWSVRNEELAGIPARPFWRVIDRTDELGDEQVGKSHPPGAFRMVLDGQQRVQSLLLAFGGDPWGLRLTDREWSEVLETERPKGKNARKHWSLGHLCLDLCAFRDQLAAAPDLENVDFRDALEWVVLSPEAGRSGWGHPPNYKYPIPSKYDDGYDGRFVQLSRLWDLAPADLKPPERFFREKLETELNKHGVAIDSSKEVLAPLAELMIKLVDVKQASVPYLQLSPFDADAGGKRDVYDDAIVNIFTRLNSAGRALTRQEITFAWIKNGWGDGTKTGNRTARKCFEDLKKSLADANVAIDIDGLVGMVSVMWAVIHSDGALLTAGDLLRGEKVRPMALDLVESWNTIAENAVEGARLVSERSFIFGSHYRSLNVLTLLLTWRLLGRQWIATHQLNVTDRDSFEKALESTFADYCDRWILMSQWSGRWGKSTDKALAEYSKDLATDWVELGELDSQDKAIEVLKGRLSKWVEALRSDSSRYIDDLAVLKRERVHEYYLPLWLWHRLDDARWRASKISLRESKRRNLRCDVDHVVAVGLWKSLQGVPEQENSEDDDALADDEIVTTMNALGNCCLLEKTFNISKGAEPLKAFLERVYEFKGGVAEYTVEGWRSDLGLDSVLVDPIGETADKVCSVIRDRTVAMKADLNEYLEGTRQRVDL